MASLKTKPFNIQLSSYGYGMMAMSTTIAILLLNGFFQRTGPDLLATWFVVILALASGALSIALVRVNLPQLRKPVAMTYATLLLIILFASYLTSFFGYSEIYVLYFLKPLPMHDFSFSKFMEGLTHMWLAVTLVAVICTVAYLIIQYLTPAKKHSDLEINSIPEETDGLAE